MRYSALGHDQSLKEENRSKVCESFFYKLKSNPIFQELINKLNLGLKYIVMNIDS